MPGVVESEEEREVEVQKKSSKKMGMEQAPVVESPEKKQKKKRKSEEENGVIKKKKKLENGDAQQVVEEATPNPLALDNFRISEAVKVKLREKGILALFPIQAQTFDFVLDGTDLVARARTGQGKTLAFVLPILESLKNKIQKTQGRAPSVLVLAPTRELAKQVHGDFEFYGAALGLKTVCIYGGSPMQPQENSLRKGVDVIVGTPGRVKDFYERGTLNLTTLKFRVLDEADEMMKMGFREDVELILSGVEDLSSVQTLLFSATMPSWVQEIANKFFKPSKKTVDLVGNSKMKASTSIRHLLMPCIYTVRPQVVQDVIKVYGSAGRVIVFTETKNDATELTSALGSLCRPLHGDIPQAQRETTLAGFRSGKFSVLVATDVAARGLDINDVELVIQCEPPKSVETYIHRSGRTGRAGNTGVNVLLYDRRKEYLVSEIQHKAGVTFENVSPPQPSTIARESGLAAARTIGEVSDSVLPLFREAAQEFIKSSGLDPVDAFAKALAKVTGYTTVTRRSLQTSHQDAATMHFKADRAMHGVGYVFSSLRAYVDEELMAGIRRMNLTKDKMGAVFDVASKDADKFVTTDDGFSVEFAEELPPLDPKPENNYRNNNSGGGYGGGGGFGNRGRGGRSFGGNRGGRGGRGGWSR